MRRVKILAACNMVKCLAKETYSYLWHGWLFCTTLSLGKWPHASFSTDLYWTLLSHLVTVLELEDQRVNFFTQDSNQDCK